jgi:hypothetical protein
MRQSCLYRHLHGIRYRYIRTVCVSDPESQVSSLIEFVTSSERMTVCCTNLHSASIGCVPRSLFLPSSKLPSAHYVRFILKL